MSRHDRLVDTLYIKTVRFTSTLLFYSTGFNHNTSDRDYFKNIPNTPDIVIVIKALDTVFVIEVGCTFDLYLETCYLSKLLKYQPLIEAIINLTISAS